MKSFSAPALAALAAGEVLSSGAIYIGAPEPIRAWGGHGSLVIDSQVFVGVGDRGLISASAGTLGTAEQGAEVTLSGVDPSLLNGNDMKALKGAPVVIWRLIFNSTGSDLLQASVYLRGRVDDAPREDTPGDVGTIRVRIEGAARGLGRRSARMRTDADQRLISGTDGSLRRVSFAGERVIYAGGKPPVRAGAALGGNNPGGGGGGFGIVNQEVLA